MSVLRRKQSTVEADQIRTDEFVNPAPTTPVVSTAGKSAFLMSMLKSGPRSAPSQAFENSNGGEAAPAALPPKPNAAKAGQQKLQKAFPDFFPCGACRYAPAEAAADPFASKHRMINDQFPSQASSMRHRPARQTFDAESSSNQHRLHLQNRSMSKSCEQLRPLWYLQEPAIVELFLQRNSLDGKSRPSRDCPRG